MTNGVSEMLERQAQRDPNWIQHDGGDCPCLNDTVVDVKYRNGIEYRGAAGRLMWDHQQLPGDIIGYRFITDGSAFHDPAPPAGGLKYDGEKPRMDLLDSYAMEQLASVLTFGAKKYAAHNWRKGIAHSRLIAAALRHIHAFNNGEDLDPESGLPHIAHAMCCVMFLLWMDKNRRDLDDRFKSEA